MKVLVTGVAGFIGMHVTSQLLSRGYEVLGIDNLNDYYDPKLKVARLSQLSQQSQHEFIRCDINDSSALEAIFERFKPNKVLHLAAQAGVRYSLTNPHAYISSNLKGFTNILEGCRSLQVEHLVYASSSSVYGGNTKIPFSEHDSVDHPVSLYAATKKSNELMAHTYSHLFSIPTTGLRFFTVYGPWGRPDMALFLFTQAILDNRPIEAFNFGKMVRDFTYVDDIVEGIIRVLEKPATPNPLFDSLNPDPATSNAPYRVFNIGNSRPVQLLDYISYIEEALGRKARINLAEMQPGDVSATNSDTTELEKWVGFRPRTEARDGVANFVKWYKEVYQWI